MAVYCIFSAQYRPTVGGVENHTYYLADQMARRGDAAIVVTSALPGLPEWEAQPNGVQVVRLPSFLPAGGKLPFVRRNARTKALMARVAALKPERVILQTRLYTLSLLGARFAKQQGLPAILIEHGHAYTTTANLLVNAGLSVYTAGLRKRILALCPSVYAVSESAAAWLDAHGVRPLGVLHNAVSADAIRDAQSKPGRDYRREAGLPPNGHLIVYTGRLMPAKGVPQLVQAVQEYNRSHEDPLCLLLAGEGALEQTLARDGDPHIRCLGRLPFAEVVALLGCADVFCLPTDMNEGLPSSLLEAAACGVYAIATNRGGIREVLPPGGEYGALLPDNRPGTLLRALEDALADPGRRAQVATRLQERVLASFSYSALWEQLSALPWTDSAN